MSRSFISASQQRLDSTTPAVSGPPITLSCWFRPSANSAKMGLLGVIKNTDGQGFFLSGDGSLGGDPITAEHKSNVAIGAASSSSGFSLNIWQHACAVFISNSSRLAYLNGANSGSNSTAVSSAALDKNQVGAIAGASYADCLIAEASIWNEDLNANEVLALANGISPLKIRRGNLLTYWPIYGLESPERNLVRGVVGLKLTLTNAPLKSDNHPPVRPISWFGFNFPSEYSTDLIIVSVGVLSLTSSIQAPEVFDEQIVPIGVLSLTSSIQTPAFELGAIVSPNAEVATFSIQEPTVIAPDVLIPIDVSVLTSSIQAPTVGADGIFAMTEVSVTFNLQAPTIIAESIVGIEILSITINLEDAAFSTDVGYISLITGSFYAEAFFTDGFSRKNVRRFSGERFVGVN
jgi:hypothetical protein